MSASSKAKEEVVGGDEGAGRDAWRPAGPQSKEGKPHPKLMPNPGNIYSITTCSCAFIKQV